MFHPYICCVWGLGSRKTTTAAARRQQQYRSVKWPVSICWTRDQQRVGALDGQTDVALRRRIGSLIFVIFRHEAFQ